MKDSASFRTDINNLEEQLSKAPESHCFAALSTLYLKAGLIDVALRVAQEGVAKHPDYLGGLRALALACHAKGLNDEALAALKRVTAALPEDIPSQLLLGRLLVEGGEQDSAIQVYRVALEFAPEDQECLLQLESLDKSVGTAEPLFMFDEGGEEYEEIIEDLEILEEFDEEYFETDSLPSEAAHDPLSTVTLAELYVNQGFITKALDIYRAILVENPLDRTIIERLAELEARNTGLPGPVGISDEYFEDEADDAAVFTAPAEELFQAVAPAPAVPLKGIADNALATLEGWLENVRRIKGCR